MVLPKLVEYLTDILPHYYKIKVSYPSEDSITIEAKIEAKEGEVYKVALPPSSLIEQIDSFDVVSETTNMIILEVVRLISLHDENVIPIYKKLIRS